MKPRLTFARSWWPVLALLALAGAAYRGVWDLGFASEDFLILGHLHQRPLTEVLLEELKGPWLGLSFVSFYRPISTVLLALELRLWGLDPTPFHLAHLLLHGVNSCLVWSIARRLIPSSAALPLAAGALFAVSPLHPSAVAFVGSYATIFGGFFSLLALATYLASRSSRRKGPYAVALAASALALGSYEGAVALPVVLAMASLLLHGQALAVEPARRWQRSLEALRPAVPFFLLLAAYFFLRRAVLGVLVGGYGVFRERLLSHFLDLLGDFLASLPLLIVPDLHRLPSLVGEALVGALLAVSSLAFFLLGRRRQPLAAVALAALVWTFVFELPISFVRVLPATGRFWYLASFSATLMGLALFAGALSAVRSRRPSKLTANFVGGGALGALLLLQLGWLRSDLALYRLADLEVRRLRNALEEMRDEASALRTVLVAGAPDFVRTDGLQPVAKVFQYGLHEAAAPPFAADGLFVYPLPPDAPAELMPALSRVAGGPVLRWNRERQRLEPWPAVGLEEEAPGRIALLGGVSGAPSEKLSFRCREGARVRLFLLTPGPPYRSGFETVSGGRGEIELPRSFLSGMAGLYRGRALGWLEDRDSRGRLVAASEIFSLSLESFEDR